MDVTDNRGYPYPECDPPLVKDASDIANLRDLAVAVDADVQGVFDLGSDVIARPDACRMGMSAIVASTAASVVPVQNFLNFDTTANLPDPMGDTVNGWINIREVGWYEIGTFGIFTSATFLGLRSRFLFDGAPATTWSPQADIAASNNQISQLSVVNYVARPNTTLQAEFRIGAASPSYTYVARIWAQQVIKG